jgi:hypothetical protein
VGPARPPDRELTGLRDTIEHLARLERAPCSEGEHEAAEWIAAQLRDCGHATRVEQEEVHGTFLWPLGLLATIGAAGGLAALAGRGGGGGVGGEGAALAGRRRVGVVAGALAAAAMWEDLAGGWRRPFRRLLPRGTTHNVVAEAGDPEAPRTLVVFAHHDAARTSFIFDQTVPRLVVRRLPRLIEQLDRWPPLMGLVIGGPALVAAGSLLRSRALTAAGIVLGTGTTAVMADMQRNEVVPGANDNLTGVAVLVELGRRLAERPPKGLRVVLASMGSEEANQEGMIGFARRHFDSMPRESTWFLCLDTVGSPELMLIEGEGFLRMRDYPDGFKDLMSKCAMEARVHLRRGLRFTFATDGLIPLRAGYPTVSVGSVNEYLVPSNYHWPTDTPDRVDYDSVAGALELVHQVVRRLERVPPGAP